MNHPISKLFEPFILGDLKLPNRIAMAPLTRNRAEHGSDAPGDLNALYYEQRSGAGLIISEATQISRQGQGYIWTPGLYTQAQVQGWKKVTDRVHAAKGHIFAQIWHVGRISHTSLQPDNGAPVAPSAIPAKGKTFVETGFVDVSTPRALEADEIPGIISDYVLAARNAKLAGFDGIEVHAANGYLIEQFLKDGTNNRTDHYGGSLENRARFGLEVVDAVLKAFPQTRIGIRISPVSPANDVTTSDPAAIFGYFISELAKRNLAYLHVIEGSTGGPRDIAPFNYAALRKAFPGAYIANNGYDRQMAIDAIENGTADMVAFGRPFIANPDLVARLQQNAPLNPLNNDTLYGGGAEGYTDYPALSAAHRRAP
jgi:N-ethylmaleimide reductase